MSHSCRETPDVSQAGGDNEGLHVGETFNWEGMKEEETGNEVTREHKEHRWSRLYRSESEKISYRRKLGLHMHHGDVKPLIPAKKLQISDLENVARNNKTS